jgi:hypothetical protein
MQIKISSLRVKNCGALKDIKIDFTKLTKMGSNYVLSEARSVLEPVGTSFSPPHSHPIDFQKNNFKTKSQQLKQCSRLSKSSSTLNTLTSLVGFGRA